MNDELLKLRRTLVLSSLMVLAGIIIIPLFWVKEISIFYLFSGLALLILGVYIFVATFKEINKKTGKSFDQAQDKPKNDGWEYLGDHCYCSERYREDHD